MKTRKLRLVALLVAAMCLLIAGCTDTGIKDNTEKEKLLIGSDIYSPYFYLDDNGDFAGIDIEIAAKPADVSDLQLFSSGLSGRIRLSISPIIPSIACGAAFP